MQTLAASYLVHYYDRESVPVIEVDQGETFSIETHDMFRDVPPSGTDWSTDRARMRGGVTGPVYVRGATPGAVLAIEVLAVTPKGGYGVMMTQPGKGCFATTQPPGYTKHVLPVDSRYVYFGRDLKLDLRPMVGKIGVAPAGQPVHCSTPGPHGGNLDSTMIGPGATVYLPISVEGALLSLGDVHAAMGDGESIGTGVEIAAEVKLRCRVTQEPNISNPLVVRQNRVATVASAATMEDAARAAFADMAALLRSCRGLSQLEAMMLTSAAADLRVCQVVNPLVTMRVEMDTGVAGFTCP